MKKIIIPLFEEFNIEHEGKDSIIKTEDNQDKKYFEIPEDCGMSEDIEEYEGSDYDSWFYFGNCKNTVDIDRMWDATEMAEFIRGCKLYINNKVPHFFNGDRNIPVTLMRTLGTINNLSEIDLSQIVLGVDENQRIGFIYLTSKDTHYFFDIKQNK